MFYQSAYPETPPVVTGNRISLELSPFKDWFAIEDGERVLDVPATFASRNVVHVALKLLATSYTTFSLILSLLSTENWNIYFGGMTGISLTCSVIYLWLSLANSIKGVEQPRRLEKVSIWSRFQWFFFHFALHVSFLSTTLWWVTVYDENVTLTLENVSVHGGTLLALLLEGFLGNRTPIHWYFWWLTGLPMSLTFVLFTYLFTGLNVGSPDYEESDLIYQYFDWKNDIMWAAIRSAFVVLVISPVVQTLIFCISLYGRRHVDERANRKSDQSATQQQNGDTSLHETSSEEAA
uniref:Uncharacterized protein n=1 Tax=Amphora coffeiformis TaxID=265554 RepID=A0A7S3L797_9STRA|mmetsp:Transcript_2164/g.4739  ORF Transcript_2164/g.4739 Transcript_2164/m.4739 type:complete len:293 (+) Transcript_2164:81-959(+)